MIAFEDINEFNLQSNVSDPACDHFNTPNPLKHERIRNKALTNTHLNEPHLDAQSQDSTHIYPMGLASGSSISSRCGSSPTLETFSVHIACGPVGEAISHSMRKRAENTVHLAALVVIHKNGVGAAIEMVESSVKR